ncbi:MAG: hypothetical protein LAT57_11665 [Balneolales bacterium]|nr:hypothetical protein [Balneolales bacterium]
MKKIAVLVLFVFSAGLGQLSAQDSSEKVYRSSDNTLFILPTGQTVPEGTHQLNSFQLFFLSYNYGVTERLQVGASAFFPLSVEIFRYSFGINAKYQFVQSDNFDAAAIAVILPASSVGLTMASGTYTSGRVRFHGGLGLGVSFDDLSNRSPFIGMLGSDVKIGGRTSFMFEYTTFADGLFDDANGLATLGFRFDLGRGNVDIGGIRPGGISGDFIAFPFIRATIEF